MEGPDSDIEWAVTTITCLQSELRETVKRIERRRETDRAHAEQLYADLDVNARMDSLENRLWRAGVPQ